MIGIIITTVLAIVLGLILVLVDAKLNTMSNTQKEILDHLPGYNCGVCGFGSCEGMSEAMLKDLDNYKKCKPMKGDTLIEMEKLVARLKTK